MTLRRSVTIIALGVLLVARTASAAPITLVFTVDRPEPLISVNNVFLRFQIFSAPSNDWPNSLPPNSLGVVNLFGVPVGVNYYSIDLNAPLDTLFFTGIGSYDNPPGKIGLNGERTSLFAAEPPSGPVSGSTILGYGPPWISLAQLLTQPSLSGQLELFYGFSVNRGDIVGAWSVTTVPEPATLVLLSTGLTALVARRRRVRTS